MMETKYKWLILVAAIVILIVLWATCVFTSEGVHHPVDTAQCIWGKWVVGKVPGTIDQDYARCGIPPEIGIINCPYPDDALVCVQDAQGNWKWRCETHVVCETGGGEWKNFPDNCGDECVIIINPGEGDPTGKLCISESTWGCDCGDGMCWDGEDCVEDGN